jgi:methionine synthase I (cobalamin-dependent)
MKLETRGERDQRRWFDAKLGDRVLICDGAMGTMLQSAGAAHDRWLPELNLSRPDMVSAIHRAYVAAGADILETNTFGANSVTMTRFGVKADIALVNRRATELARVAAAAAERRVLVAGSLAPASAPASRGEAPDAQAHEALLEQVRALESAGVDLLMFDTFSDLSALAALIASCGSQLPIVAQVTFLNDGKTIGGDSPEEVADILGGLGVVAFGANCALDPRAILPVIERLAGATSMPLIVQPVVGTSPIDRERTVPRDDEESFAHFATKFATLGASIVGGCCGTTPKHIEAIAHRFRATLPISDASPVHRRARS